MDAGRSGGRRRKPLAAGTFQPEISSFRLALAAEAKAAKTVRMYTEAVQWFAAAHLIPQTSRTRWEQVTGQDVQWWMVWLLSRYSESYASNQYRALQQFLITVRGKDGKQRIVKISYPCARTLDRYLRARSRHAQAWRPQLWLGINNRGPMTAQGIYQMIVRHGRQCGVRVYPPRFRHHFSHTWLDRGGAEGDLMEFNGWASPQMLRRYGASARSARARRTYDRIMSDNP